LDQGVCPGFPVVEGLPFLATHYVQTGGGSGVICLHCSGLPRIELGAGTG